MAWRYSADAVDADVTMLPPPRRSLSHVCARRLGKELEPLSRASKAPLSNLGVLLPFGLKRLQERVGMLDKPSIGWAPAPLRPAADAIESAIGAFAAAARDLVIKHGKGILEQQLHVEKVADVVSKRPLPRVHPTRAIMHLPSTTYTPRFARTPLNRSSTLPRRRPHCRARRHPLRATRLQQR